VADAGALWYEPAEELHMSDALNSTFIDAWAQPALPQLRHRVPEVERLLRQSHSPLGENGLGPDETVAAMDEAGISAMMLCAWCRPGQWVFTNDEVAEFTRRHPNRFYGVATVDLERPVRAVQELERAVKELGFKALRVIPWLWKIPPNDRLYYPLYVKCIELGIPFCTQVGHTGPLMPSDTGRPIPYLDEVALTFPELTLVGGHIGYPWTDEMIALAWKHERVYIDTSAYLPAYYPPQLVQFMATYGKDKVLFGTNFPQLSLVRCTEQARSLPLPPAAQAAFFHENARRVFQLSER
jgi:predicted TIM-barrel fold metal-dependent hydrolase